MENRAISELSLEPCFDIRREEETALDVFPGFSGFLLNDFALTAVTDSSPLLSAFGGKTDGTFMSPKNLLFSCNWIIGDNHRQTETRSVSTCNRSNMFVLQC